MQKLKVITLQGSAIRDFSSVRNRELARADAEWVLFLDADERMTPGLKEEIDKAINKNVCDAYRVRRIDQFMGRDLLYGETGSVKPIRLAKKNAGSWKRPVHEVWDVHGTVGELQNPLFHTPHDSIAGFLDKINTYSTIEADFRFREGRRSSLLHIAVYPAAKWVKNYLVLQGFRDGVPGMIMAVMMSLHSFLTWTKLYLLWRAQ